LIADFGLRIEEGRINRDEHDVHDYEEERFYTAHPAYPC
jgi:hypothetical protein